MYLNSKVKKKQFSGDFILCILCGLFLKEQYVEFTICGNKVLTFSLLFSTIRRKQLSNFYRRTKRVFKETIRILFLTVHYHFLIDILLFWIVRLIYVKYQWDIRLLQM